MRQEIREELGVPPSAYTLQGTELYQEFVFGPGKKLRAGKRGRYRVFLIDANSMGEVAPTKELKSAHWLAEDQVLKQLTFDDVRELFRQAVRSL